ncbi:hypothetical protein LJC33_08825 [Eubacteriales bacterium OttesenSCG-928-N13]|nr:hypothetical protein [Eubacteriales bacterium OttesenSCG-928-N13]
MKQFTVELDEMVCCWLEHISKVTGETIEKIISNGIYHQVTMLEDDAVKMFTYSERQ